MPRSSRAFKGCAVALIAKIKVKVGWGFVLSITWDVKKYIYIIIGMQLCWLSCSHGRFIKISPRKGPAIKTFHRGGALQRSAERCGWSNSRGKLSIAACRNNEPVPVGPVAAWGRPARDLRVISFSQFYRKSEITLLLKRALRGATFIFTVKYLAPFARKNWPS